MWVNCCRFLRLVCNIVSVQLLVSAGMVSAYLFTPWWMYSSTPSRLKADDSATSAKRASNHEFRNMFVVVECRCGSERKWASAVRVSFDVVTRFAKSVSVRIKGICSKNSVRRQQRVFVGKTVV